MKLRFLFVLVVLLASCKHYEPPKESPEKPPLGPDVLQIVSADVGAHVGVPIRIVPERAVALQFDLEFDPDVLELQGGSNAPEMVRASKELTVRRVRRGVARVVVFGFNLDPLPKGTLGEVQFRVIGEAKRSEVLAVRRAAPDAEGQDQETSIRDGQIIVQRR